MEHIDFMSFLTQMLQKKRELSKRVDLVKMIWSYSTIIIIIIIYFLLCL